MKKILIYAHYYAPDVASTGQILQDLAEGIKKYFDVTVVCTVPSYTGNIDEKYKTKKIYKEIINGIKVIRVAVPEFNKSSKISRIRNLIAYFIYTRKVTRKIGPQGYVLALSQPPIMGGLLGVYGKKVIKSNENKSVKFIYCIQDFNPEQIEVTGFIKIKPLLKVLKMIDNRSCRKADLIVTVGRDLGETIESRFKNKHVPKYAIINNWIDENIIYPLDENNHGLMAFKKKYGIDNSFVIMYSGNIGLYYDLEGIIKVIEKLRGIKTSNGKKVVFAFVGEGSVLPKLVKYSSEHNLDNVVFIPYQDKNELIYSLNAGDVHWCVNAKGIKGVSCPSKFYGIAGAGKPVLGVLEKGSEIERLINEINCGKVCEPEKYEQIESNIRWFIDNSNSEKLKEMGGRGREYLVDHLTKSASIKKYIKAINEL